MTRRDEMPIIAAQMPFRHTGNIVNENIEDGIIAAWPANRAAGEPRLLCSEIERSGLTLTHSSVPVAESYQPCHRELSSMVILLLMPPAS